MKIIVSLPTPKCDNCGGITWLTLDDSFCCILCGNVMTVGVEQ